MNTWFSPFFRNIVNSGWLEPPKILLWFVWWYSQLRFGVCLSWIGVFGGWEILLSSLSSSSSKRMIFEESGFFSVEFELSEFIVSFNLDRFSFARSFMEMSSSELFLLNLISTKKKWRCKKCGFQKGNSNVERICRL